MLSVGHSITDHVLQEHLLVIFQKSACPSTCKGALTLLVCSTGKRGAPKVSRNLATNLEHATGLLVDKARNALDTAAARQTPNGGLGNALDVIPQDLAVTLGAALAKALAALAASRHGFGSCELVACKAAG